MLDGMFEVSVVLQGVVHVLVVRALGVEDVVSVRSPPRGPPRAREAGGPAACTSSRGLFSHHLSGCWFASRRGAAGAGFTPPMRSWARSSMVMSMSASQNNYSEVAGAFWSMARTKAESLDPR